MSVWIEPTEEQQAEALAVQREVISTINRLGREGVHPAILTAGVGAALADLVTSQHGAQMVPKWFQRQALIAAKLVQPQLRKDLN